MRDGSKSFSSYLMLVFFVSKNTPANRRNFKLIYISYYFFVNSNTGCDEKVDDFVYKSVLKKLMVDNFKTISLNYLELFYS